MSFIIYKWNDIFHNSHCNLCLIILNAKDIFHSIDIQINKVNNVFFTLSIGTFQWVTISAWISAIVYVIK